MSESYLDAVTALPNGRAIVKRCSSALGSVAYDSYESDGVFNGPISVPTDRIGAWGCGRNAISSEGIIVFSTMTSSYE